MPSDYNGSDELLVPQEITGYRAWQVMPMDIPPLRSCGRYYFWVPGINDAQCISGGWSLHDTSAPNRDCTCGFYARTQDDDHGYGTDGICGVIKASGRVVLGRRGFRAEHARIVALYTNWWNSGSELPNILDWRVGSGWATSWKDAKEKLSAFYGVPIFSSKEEAFKAFPPDDLSALLPPEPEPVPGVATHRQLTLNADGSIVLTLLDGAGQPISSSTVTRSQITFT